MLYVCLVHLQELSLLIAKHGCRLSGAYPVDAFVFRYDRASASSDKCLQDTYIKCNSIPLTLTDSSPPSLAWGSICCGLSSDVQWWQNMLTALTCSSHQHVITEA